MNEDIIYQAPAQIGGDTVTALVDSAYKGPCAVLEDNGQDVLVCALPDYEEARKAAIFATSPDGGYGSTKIIRCTKDDVTHEDFITWAFFG